MSPSPNIFGDLGGNRAHEALSQAMTKTIAALRECANVRMYEFNIKKLK